MPFPAPWLGQSLLKRWEATPGCSICEASFSRSLPAPVEDRHPEMHAKRSSRRQFGFAQSAIPPVAASRHSQDSCLIQGCVPRGSPPPQNWPVENKPPPATHERAMNSNQPEGRAPGIPWPQRNPLCAPLSWQVLAASVRAGDQAIKRFPNSIERRRASPGDRRANRGCNSPQGFPVPDGTRHQDVVGHRPACSLALPRQLC